jgi:DNA repair exonuclease SbcCD ATPase subunit
LLNIKRTRAANFRSIGNIPLEFDYTQTNTTLITANKNGSGKSSLVLHSLVYAFYNKSYDKDTRLPDLVNATNKKLCKVEVDFDAKGVEWTVRRGQKPAIFQLFADGKEVMADKHNDEKQVFLESLLGMDYKNFCFTVALGRDRFVPFISMSTSERRVAVDAIWDLFIFSKMQTIAKKSLSELKKDKDQCQTDKRILERDLEHAISMFNEVQSSLSDTVAIWEQQKDKLTTEKDLLLSELKFGTQELGSLKETLKVLDELQSRHSVLMLGLQGLVSKQGELSSAIRKAEDSCVCGSCGQDIPKAKRDADLSLLRAELATIVSKIDKANQMVLSLAYDAPAHGQLKQDIQAKTTHLGIKLSRVKTIDADLKDVCSQLDKSNDDLDGRLEECQSKIAEIEQSIQSKTEEFDSIQKQIDSYSTAVVLLSDDGVKQEIIEAYIPELNKRCNDYLNILGLPVTIEISSAFDVNIVSPNKKGLPIQALSSGQKCRIDLSLLFAFRDIAMMQSTMDCNLLVLDETLESLSEEGAIAFSDLCKAKLGNMNVCVISQRSAEFEVLFERTVTFGIKDDFTVID